MADFSAVRGIYFDLDDTLCGYWTASKIGMRLAFEQHPVDGKTPDDMIEAWASTFRRFSSGLKNDTDLYKQYCKTGEVTRTMQMRHTLAAVRVDDEALAAALSETYMVERDRHLKLFPEAVEVLDNLKSRFPLGLITNGPADIQRQEIATCGVEHYFDHIYIEGELGMGKPERHVFDEAARAMGLGPEALLFVGNSYHHDIAPAIEYGWHTAWVRRDTDVAPSMKQPEAKPESAPEPDLVIGDLRELLPLLSV